MNADLSALIARLEAAEVGSRELGREVVAATNPCKSGAYSRWATAAAAFDWSIDVTTNLDAALALAERVLPGWRIGLNSDPDRGPLWAAQVKRRGETWRPIGELAPTSALALCIAILRAKQGEGG